MTTYTVSFYGKTTGGWPRFHHTIERDSLPTHEECISIVTDIAKRAGVSVVAEHTIQLEEGNPALPYIPQHKHKHKNTNAWKPRGYGK